MNIPSQIVTLLAGIILTLVSLWYGQNHHLLPIAASEVAPLVDSLFDTMMVIGTGIFLLVNGILIYSVIKFRRDPNDDTDGPPVHGNIPLEIVWTAIPAVIVLGLSIYSFDVYQAEGGQDPMDHSVAHHGKNHTQMAKMSGAAVAAPLIADSQGVDATPLMSEDLPPKQEAPALGTVSPKVGDSTKPTEFVVNAAGMQYAWLFTYPDTEVVAGELHVPINRNVLINISANDVIHAFWVPEFRLKQDAVPGRQTEVRFVANRLGEYPLICAELCGAYHGAMKTKIVVESQADFDTWLQTQIASAEVGLDRAIATTPATLTEVEYLAPYAKEIGVTAGVLQQLQPAAAKSVHAPSIS
ncbi:MAG: cytochrome c oxidase subunit II [Leptolyngbyaceae cyanobacterium CSU_1_3]|nr:cytochrome c oxidase subunit II [Leptolyngbyaceae cyanobacterium CSU_1_3]